MWTEEDEIELEKYDLGYYDQPEAIRYWHDVEFGGAA